MGWSNFIIIDTLKLVIETNREVDDIEDYEKDALSKMTDIDEFYDMDTDIDMQDIKINEISIGNLAVLYNAYKNASSITDMHRDKFLLYWLTVKEIEYDIKSEHNIDLEYYIENGYNILRRV